MNLNPEFPADLRLPLISFTSLLETVFTSKEFNRFVVLYSHVFNSKREVRYVDIQVLRTKPYWLCMLKHIMWLERAL
jgi:hypothetical protein